MATAVASAAADTADWLSNSRVGQLGAPQESRRPDGATQGTGPARAAPDGPEGHLEKV